jgi:hypothetical protein
VLSNADQAVAVAFNSDGMGDNGLGVRVAGATGEVSVTEKGRPVRASPQGALEVGTEYYVNMTISSGTAVAQLSTTNFAGVPGSELVGQLEIDSLSEDTSGNFVSIGSKVPEPALIR